eukprot:130427-Rhodomonas_salina.2
MANTELMNCTNSERTQRELHSFLHSRVGGDYELQRVASALAEGACFRKDKTDNAILLGDVRRCRSGGPDSCRARGATDQG